VAPLARSSLRLAFAFEWICTNEMAAGTSAADKARGGIAVGGVFSHSTPIRSFGVFPASS
jgi:hypothetical protein